MTKSFIFYASRVIQRLALCLVVGATIIHWSIMITIAGSNRLLSGLDGNVKNPAAFNAELSKIVNAQSLVVLRWVIVCAAITLLLLCIKRYRTYEKTLIIDSLVITAFCVASVAFSQMIIRAFILGL